MENQLKNRNYQRESDIDLIDLFYNLFTRLHIIGIAAALCGVLLFVYSFFLVTPTYQATSKIYIVSSSKDSVVDISDLNIGTSLTKDYEQLILSYPVLDEVITKCNLHTDSEHLAGKIAISNPPDTRILNITVSDTNAKKAAEIANTVSQVSIRYLPETMSSNPPNIAQKARAADHKSSPNCFLFTFFGVLLGILCSSGFFIIRYLLDDTITSSEDMEHDFGLIPMTIIPENSMINQEKGKTRRWKK